MRRINNLYNKKDKEKRAGKSPPLAIENINDVCQMALGRAPVAPGCHACVHVRWCAIHKVCARYPAIQIR